MIQSVLQGGYMRWMVSREGDLSAFMRAEVRDILAVLYPDERFQP